MKKLQLSIAVLLASAALIGCDPPTKKYLITYEVQAKGGGLIRGTTVQEMPSISELNITRVLTRVYDNPSVQTNGIVVLTIIKLDRD